MQASARERTLAREPWRSLGFVCLDNTKLGAGEEGAGGFYKAGSSGQSEAAAGQGETDEEEEEKGNMMTHNEAMQCHGEQADAHCASEPCDGNRRQIEEIERMTNELFSYDAIKRQVNLINQAYVAINGIERKP